jgi:hypothetical protein
MKSKITSLHFLETLMRTRKNQKKKNSYIKRGHKVIRIEKTAKKSYLEFDSSCGE